MGVLMPHPDPLDNAEDVARLRDENQRLAMQCNALEEVIRGVVMASRPGTPSEERERAWRAAGAMVAMNDRRKDKDFVARLAEVKARHQQHSLDGQGRT